MSPRAGEKNGVPMEVIVVVTLDDEPGSSQWVQRMTIGEQHQSGSRAQRPGTSGTGEFSD